MFHQKMTLYSIYREKEHIVRLKKMCNLLEKEKRFILVAVCQF